MKNKQEDDLVIRSIKKNDVTDIYNLLNDLDEQTKIFFHPHPFDIETITNICLSKTDHYFAMFLKNKLIGYSFLRLFGYDIPSFGIVIRKGYTSKGYGMILCKWTIDKAKELGYKKVILKTYKDNFPAQELYKRIGFIIIGESEDKKEYRMELNL